LGGKKGKKVGKKKKGTGVAPTGKRYWDSKAHHQGQNALCIGRVVHTNHLNKWELVGEFLGGKKGKKFGKKKKKGTGVAPKDKRY